MTRLLLSYHTIRGWGTLSFGWAGGHKISTLSSFWLSFPPLKAMSNFFFSLVRPSYIAIQRPMLYWPENYHESRETMRVWGYIIRLVKAIKLISNLNERNEINFEFIFYHCSLIWLNLTVIFFIVVYSDFVIFKFYEYYFL